jgi:hypothetical protein
LIAEKQYPGLWALSLAILAFLPAAPAGADDPEKVWFTLTTPHFWIHYYRNGRHDERKVAEQVARRAEKAHAVLAPLFRYAPRSRTHIVVEDTDDGANGSAQVTPRNVVSLRVTHPGSLTTLNDYDDWLYALLVHEYAHILHIDTISGLPKIINSIFGKLWAPNQMQPRWFIEGLATFHESERTSGGRVRGNIFDMMLRMAVLEGTFLRIDQISSNTRIFPRGEVPYLYGSRFIKFIADKHGEDKLTEISQRYGGSFFPWGINRVAHNVMGQTYIELYREFEAYLTRRYQRQAQEVRKRGITLARKVTDHGEGVGVPRISVDGKELVFIDHTPHRRSLINVLDVETNRVVQTLNSYGGNVVDISPDRRYLVASQRVNWRTYYGYHDLYLRDRRTLRTRRLTWGLRAADPAFSPDGRRVAFVSNDLGKTDLMLIPFEGGRARLLRRGKASEQVFTPRFSPDGRELIFSIWTRGGQRDIRLLELRTGKEHAITADRALDVDPVFSADGRTIYFASDRSGIFNLYAFDRISGQLRQVSNVLGGAFSPAVLPSQSHTYYVGYSAKGFDVHQMALEPKRYLALLPDRARRPPPPTIDDTTQYVSTPYSALRTLLPETWSFSVANLTAGAEVNGADVVGRHSYRLRLDLAFDNGHPNYRVDYSYSGLWPSLSLRTSRSESGRGGIQIDGQGRQYTEEAYAFNAGVGLPVLRMPEHAVSISIDYRLTWYRDADDTRVLVEPGMLSARMPQVGILAGFGLSIGYSNTERYPRSISAESGREISLGLSVNHQALGSDFRSTTFSWSWAEYISLPWFEGHVIALRYGGGLAWSDGSRARSAFGIGGFPDQDVFRAIIETAPIGGNYLRGYAPNTFVGDRFHLLNVEYRFPLLDIERGLSSLPLYLNNVHLALFTDVGHAFFGDFKPAELNVGVGAEVLVEGVVGYVVPLTLRIGYARGLMEKGSNEFHLLVGRRF